MALKEKVSKEELALYEVLRHPVLSGEFIENIDKLDYEEEFEYHDYQKEYLCDFNNYVSIVAARAVGKTVVLVKLIVWIMINKVFPNDYIVYTVPNKVHLEPVWNGLTRNFRTNSVLKHFIEPNRGINSSSYTIKLLNGQLLDCRIAGTSGAGVNVIGMHSPFEILDECIVGTQRVAGNKHNKIASKLKVGDSVLSWNGEEIEKDRIKSIKKIERKQKILEIGFNNSYIRVGENHRIYTDSGYVLASELKPDQNIYLFNNTERKYWTDDEIDLVFTQIYNGAEVKEIANRLNRSTQSVFKKIDELGLTIKGIFDAPLSDEQLQIITGSLLGDGSISKYVSRASYTTNHSYKQKEYVDWLYNRLKRICRLRPRVYKNGGWGTWNYRLSTLGHPQILELANKLYINNIKTITREYLNLLDELGLAIWFMDDGSHSSLATHSFSKKENEIIVEYFKDRWDINCSVKQYKNKDLYYIQINNFKDFISIVKPYIIPSMLYKIGLGIRSNDFPPLPKETAEDNSTLDKVKVRYIKEVNTRAKCLYSIEVEKNHNFFVNGVLTKNSGYYPWGTWLELQPTLNTWTKGFRLIVSGVPTGLRENNVNYHADMDNSSFTKHRVSAYDNPRFTEEDEARAIEQYGGKESQDFIHLVLGQHGAPVFAVFDRRLFEISNYKSYQLELNGIKLKENIGQYIERISLFPPVPENRGVIFGIDLGYTDPSAIVILYLDSDLRFRFHGRIKLVKVPYPLQKTLIDRLDDKFNPSLLGVDEGHAGIAVTQGLLQEDLFIHKEYEKQLVAVNFASHMSLGFDSDGSELKVKVRPFSVSLLQEYSNDHRIIYTSTDLEMVAELERMTYSRTQTGDIIYKTLTPRGGKRGEDHFTSALLSAMMAWYLTNEQIIKRKRPKLFSSRWFM